MSQTSSNTKPQLFTRNYGCMLCANFLLYMAFWMLVPILPFYLGETFGASGSLIGIVLSCYTVSALTIRPFSGYLIDTFARKPLYIVAYVVFTVIFAGYALAGTLTIFLLLRILHGLAFGTVTVGGNTIVIDIMPSERRGEGLGYFGLTNNFAMAMGPMVGLFLHESLTYERIFFLAFTISAVGLLVALMVKTKRRPTVVREAVSLDRFFLKRGVPAGISLLMLAIPYGMTTNYVAIYAQQIGITLNTGIFFTCMALGMAASRIFSGKLVDRGMLTRVIKWGMYLAIVSFALLSGCRLLMQRMPEVSILIFFATALLLGISFGIMFPAFNTLFVNLAPNSQRGTATSTYLTSWDVGIGIGILAGGHIAEVTTLDHGYIIGVALTLVSFLYFRHTVEPHFHKYKLR